MSTTAPRLPEPFELKLHVPPGNAEGFEQWRVGISPMFAVDVAEPDEPQHYRLESVAYMFAGLSISRASLSATTLDRSAQTIARSGIDDIDVLVHFDGDYRLTANGRETEVKAGDICLLDMTRPCRIETRPYADLSVVLRRAALEPLLPNIDALHGAVVPSGSPLNALLLTHLRTLYAQAPNLDTGEAAAAARATGAVIASCIGPRSAARELASEAVATAAVLRLRRLIEVHLDDPTLGPDYLIADGGISRSTLYRLFEPFGGVSTYIRQRRLARAFRMLSDPALRHERIGTVAARCGFTSDAVFSRALRRAYGMSASDIRAGIRDGHEASSGNGGNDAFYALNRWLLGLGS